MRRARPAASLPATPRASAPEQISAAIREWILDGTLRPAIACRRGADDDAVRRQPADDPRGAARASRRPRADVRAADGQAATASPRCPCARSARASPEAISFSLSMQTLSLRPALRGAARARACRPQRRPPSDAPTTTSAARATLAEPARPAGRSRGGARRATSRSTVCSQRHPQPADHRLRRCDDDGVRPVRRGRPAHRRRADGRVSRRGAGGGRCAATRSRRGVRCGPTSATSRATSGSPEHRGSTSRAAVRTRARSRAARRP